VRRGMREMRDDRGMEWNESAIFCKSIVRRPIGPGKQTSEPASKCPLAKRL
jgi:hypothetical protein